MSGEAVHLRGFTWTPLGRRTPVLSAIDLDIEPGERVLLAGPSGSGKSTLLRALSGVLTGHEAGEATGDLLVDGAPPRPDGRAGLLVQDPADARVYDVAGREVAFGPENLGLAREDIAQRVRWAMEAVGFPYGPDHPSDALSGGEAQRLALAAVLACRPILLLLDEPTSMLDPEAAAMVRGAVVQALQRSGRTTLIVVEHRLTGWLDVVDRLVVLGPDGTILADGPVRSVLGTHRDALVAAGVWVPGVADPIPLDLPDWYGTPAWSPAAQRRGEVALTARGVGLVRRPRRGLRLGRRPIPPVTAVDDVDARVRRGRLLAVRGPSGAGKSSLLDVLLGLLPPTSGTVVAAPDLARGAGQAPSRWPSRVLAQRVGWVPQQAEHTVVGPTVGDSTLATIRALGGSGRRHPEPVESGRRAGEMLELLGLRGRVADQPHQLSGGELRRLAVAASLLHGPDVLGCDEPTVGQDRHTWAAVTGLLRAARAGGTAVAVSTHDERLAAWADDDLTLSRGRERST